MNRWRKFAVASASDRSLLFEAAFLLLMARLKLAILPFAKVMPGQSVAGRGRPADGSTIQVPRVGWAVETAAHHSPFPLTCLPQALAAWRMLQSRGVSPRFIYGVTKDPATGFAAHAWVEVDGIPIVGGRAARGFTVLASFPRQ